MADDQRPQGPAPDEMTNKNRGMQGIDKAPGEEPAAAPEQFVAETQKGKNKVDGDPSLKSDKPLENQDIS
ncbi:MAG TPA: hypothetical protein VHK91_02805 [Flavisolibacter sp.]|jgi:hypothetical protein|nr:hypothetical protein [Flavisolibacter sp.]